MANIKIIYGWLFSFSVYLSNILCNRLHKNLYFYKKEVYKPEDITVSNPHEEKLLRFKELGASVTTDNKVAIAGADFITIAVKPKVVKKVIDEIKPLVDYENQMIVNMAASISIAQLSQWFDENRKSARRRTTKVVRAIRRCK